MMTHIVFLSPEFNQQICLFEIHEPVGVQTLFPEGSVEACCECFIGRLGEVDLCFVPVTHISKLDEELNFIVARWYILLSILVLEYPRCAQHHRL